MLCLKAHGPGFSFVSFLFYDRLMKKSCVVFKGFFYVTPHQYTWPWVVKYCPRVELGLYDTGESMENDLWFLIAHAYSRQTLIKISVPQIDISFLLFRNYVVKGPMEPLHFCVTLRVIKRCGHMMNVRRGQSLPHDFIFILRPVV